MSTAAFHKHDDRDDLLALASDVTSSLPCAYRQGNARDAARALAGLAGWVANRTSVVRMQECMSALVRHPGAWRHGAVMRDLPVQYNGLVDEHVALVAVVASSLAPAFGVVNLRSAMAFWATERDPAAWQALVE
jgi:hypothetical protein